MYTNTKNTVYKYSNESDERLIRYIYIYTYF